MEEIDHKNNDSGCHSVKAYDAMPTEGAILILHFTDEDAEVQRGLKRVMIPSLTLRGLGKDLGKSSLEGVNEQRQPRTTS